MARISPYTAALIVHGGAGARPAPEERQARRRALLEALERGLDLLRGAASALDAVVAAVTALEDDPLFNAGYGSALNAAGAVEMDASVMAWPVAELAQNNILARAQSGAGAVAAVSRVRNPILLARAVMESTPHVLMVGAGAERLAGPAGIARCRPQELIAERARTRWQSYHARLAHGTVGAAALDRNGQVAAATSTGGLTGKLPGRVGDSALVGAGTFAHPLGAASATGMGESIMKLNLCRGAVELLEDSTAMRAAARSITRVKNLSGAEAGLIMVDRRGHVGYAHNARAMEIAYYSAATGLHHRRLER